MTRQKVQWKHEILRVGKRAYSRCYIASNDGNISARIGKDRILITPTGMSKGFLKISDLVVIDMDGKLIRGKKKPSSEMALHLFVYRSRPDVNSVCHLHPPYATAFAVAGIPLDQHILSEAVISLGTVPLIAYGTPGTEEVYKNLHPAVKDYDAFLLANHGALTLGTDVIDAYHKMETLEHCAQILFIARHLGNVTILNPFQVKQLEALRSKFGIRVALGKKPAQRRKYF